MRAQVRRAALAGSAAAAVGENGPLQPVPLRASVRPSAMRLCVALCWCALAACALGGGGGASARRLDQDFEFDDDADVLVPGPGPGPGSGGGARPRRYVYDPHNPLCAALVCKKRELCLLRDAFTALCQAKRDVLRRGDVIVWGASASEEEDPPDDVFYDSGARDPPAPPARPNRCVGCGGAGGGGGGGGAFLCGSDNRTYSSLCRLDLHNCVRRPAPPVALACRGFCPCRNPERPARPRRRRPHDPARNDVLPARPRSRASAPARAACALDKMADRLIDWFSVLMEEAEDAPPHPPARAAGFPADCKPEVRWMFAHLDADGDGALSARDLYALRHDERERCLRPFLASCGGGAGGAGVTRAGWCSCLGRAVRPCTALARAHAGAAAAGGYVPACDARGYYRPRQCHAQLGVCWCVDAHGAETPGSRVRGEPPCPPRAAAPPADDEDGPQGSGDGAPPDRAY